MITREQMTVLVAAADILEAVRSELQAAVTLTHNDPVSRLAVLVNDLHAVISSLDNIIQAQDRR